MKIILIYANQPVQKNYHKLFNEQRGFVERKLYSRILS